MKTLIFTLTTLLMINFSFAQGSEEEEQEEQMFVFVEEAPEFPGGEDARMRFLAENIAYPEMARELGIMGTVYVQFVVEKDGRLTNINVLRGIGGGCDEEVVRVLKLMPRWKPGKQKGKAVRTQFTMPVKFILQDDAPKKKKKKKNKSSKEGSYESIYLRTCILHDQYIRLCSE